MLCIKEIFQILQKNSMKVMNNHNMSNDNNSILKCRSLQDKRLYKIVDRNENVMIIIINERPKLSEGV